MEEKLNETLDTLSTRERQLTFLLKLSDTLRPLCNPVDIEEAATKIALDFMEADRCHYGSIEGDNVIILQDASRGNLPSVSGVHTISSFAMYKAALNAGVPFVVDDVRTNNIIDEDLKKLCLQSRYGSFINVPVIKNGKLVGLLSLVQTKPRKWTDSEVQLIIETAERTWSAVERAKTEEALHNSEEKYRALFDSIDEGFSILELSFNDSGNVVDYTFLEMNSAHEAMTGLSQAAIGMRISEFVPDLEDSVFERLEKVVITGEPARYEQYVRAWNRWFDVFSSRVGGEGSRKVANVFNHITERKQAEEKIKESEKHFSNLLMESPFAFAILKGKAMVVSLANDAIKRVWGKGNDIDGKSLMSIMPEIKEQGFAALLEQVYTTGKPFYGHEELVKLQRNGIWEDVYFNFIYQPYREADETITGVTIIANEVTTQAIANKTIAASQQNVSRLFMMAPAFIAVLRGPQYVYELANEMYLQLIGKKDIIGKTVREVLPELEGQGFFELLDNVYATGEPFIGNEMPVQVDKGAGKLGEIYVNFVYQPLHNGEGEIDGIFVHGVDVTEQVLARKTIEESEEKFQAAILAVEGIIWTNNAQGEMIGEQPGWAKLTGQHFEDYQGYGWAKVIHPDDALPTVKAWNNAVADKSTFEFEHRLKTTQAGWRLFSVKAVPAFDKTGAIQQWVGVHTDITEQKLAEEKLTYRTALLEAHNQASVDGILLVDAKGKIISFNQRFIEIWNMPQHIVDAKDDEAALSFAMTQLVNPQLFIDKVKFLYENPTGTSLDELEFKDGKIVERNGYPVIGDDGSYYAWSWTFKDITKQKSYEKVIVESEQRFRILAETLPQLIWMTNEKGIYEYASSHWINYSGLDPYAGDTWEKLVHPHDLESLSQGWENSLKTGETFYSEARLKNKNGTYSWHLVQGEPIKNENGEIIKWIGAFTDIENLKEEQKQKNDFLSMASHELRTPVTTIKGYGQIIERLLEEKNDLQTLGFVKKMGKQVNRLNTLITDLLDITKMQKGGLIRNESVFNFNDLVKEVIDDMQKTTFTHQIIDNLNADLEIKGDKDKLSQVLNNLISNAIKYSPAADKIIVSTKIVKDGVQLSVQDFGIGISIGGQQRVFEQFYRVAGENQSTFQGMGIGLYICAEVIKKEGGNIWVESTGGEGSVFYVWLPVDHKDGTEGQ